MSGTIILPELYEIVFSQPKAVTIRCFDRRFRKAFNRFIREVLGLDPEDFWPLKPPGGAALLGMSSQMQSDFKVLTDQIQLAIDHSKIQHIILFAHEDCRKMDGFCNRTKDPHFERRCLISGIRLMERKYPQIEVSGFYARFTEDRQHIVFEVIKASALQRQGQFAPT